MLLDIPEQARAVVGEPAPPQTADVVAEDRHRPRGGTIEPREKTQKRGLARPAGTEDDDNLPLLDRERQALESRGVPLGGGIDAKDVSSLDRAHLATLLVDAQTRKAATAT